MHLVRVWFHTWVKHLSVPQYLKSTSPPRLHLMVETLAQYSLTRALIMIMYTFLILLKVNTSKVPGEPQSQKRFGNRVFKFGQENGTDKPRDSCRKRIRSSSTYSL